ncbi:MAG: glycoside hydrolase family 28 protein [Bacteroidales bacterium]|nr:glycoside hydrolase family 28 protein [Bacteroidales bacterium]
MKRFCFLCALFFLSGLARAGVYETLYKDLPVPLPEPELPAIPDRTVSLGDYGAVGDGITDNTAAFEKAVASLTRQGGGHLVVPAGIFLTGPIVLKDRIDLHLERNAMILLSPDKTAHLSKGKVVPGISASKRKDVSITGEGIIDGNGQWWRGVKRGKVSDVEWNAFLRMGGTVSVDGKLWYPFGLDAYPDIAGTAEAQEKMRVHMVRFMDCERVLVQGVTLQNSPKFHLIPQRCEDVVVEGVTVRCPWNAQNGDGIDISQCRRVLVTRCHVDVGDDGICMKGGAGAAALQSGPCSDILIVDNQVFHAHGGFVIGSEFSGGMVRIVVQRNTFSGTDMGLRFKSAPGRGGKCEDIFISDTYMSDIQGEAVVFETSYADRPVGHDDAVASRVQEFLPEFSDIRISRVTCRGARTAVAASGSRAMIHDIVLEDCTFFYTETATRISDPAMIRLSNVRLETY